jgi:hypothetical protein
MFLEHRVKGICWIKETIRYTHMDVDKKTKVSGGKLCQIRHEHAWAAAKHRLPPIIGCV